MKKHIFKTLAIMAGSFALLSMSIIKTNPQDPWEVPEEYQKMKNPYTSAQDADKIGYTLFSQYCSTCHGNKGQGDGVNSFLLETPVAKFTNETVKSQSDGSLYYKIVSGRNEMPTFEWIIPDEKDRWLVVNYVKSL
jgi:mono/diheme cytochrome c family protein